MKQSSAILATAACCAVVPFAAACTDLGPALNHTADDTSVSGSPAVIEIHNGAGAVRVTPGNAVHVHREIAYHSQVPQSPPTHADGALVLSAECDSCRIDYEITAPAATKIDVEGGAGAVDIEGVAQVTYHGGSGAVTIKQIAGPVDAQSGSGGVTISDASSTVSAVTKSGGIGIDLTAPPTRLSARSGSGHVSVTVPAHPYRVEAHTDSGSIHGKIPNTPGAADALTVGSGSGDIDLATS
ncbi:DUF4097 family beta strand repeat-containing protein [Nocardia terpenica]|uniref:DUF4097 domain-containing protein n=1 Tax=Nocardia terpenica TaxID=455432 RepID=A0A164J0W1_9NOCA|nr:DUF4097 family beta strand repeat-containing protein [Nocardia terpenica]KZM69931.1 hypothetical protein AWN90_04815 [Nocardia terpenica]NQE91296.1 DUF4097 family beta strand repeat protein [Nocardia terpenica]